MLNCHLQTTKELLIFFKETPDMFPEYDVIFQVMTIKEEEAEGEEGVRRTRGRNSKKRKKKKKKNKKKKNKKNPR